LDPDKPATQKAKQISLTPPAGKVDTGNELTDPLNNSLQQKLDDMQEDQETQEIIEADSRNMPTGNSASCFWGKRAKAAATVSTDRENRGIFRERRTQK
jgi:hypothetical protein